MKMLHNIFFWLTVAFCCTICRSQIVEVTAVLKDMTTGGDAAGVACSFYKLVDNRWMMRSVQLTNGAGMVANLTTAADFSLGDSFRFIFSPEAYWSAKNVGSYFPQLDVEIEKNVDNVEEPHTVIVTMSPFGYSAYRGHWKDL